MEMVYNSDSYTVVAVDLPAPGADAVGGFEIVDKSARKGIFISGLVAQGFKAGVSALVERGPTEAELDEFIAGYTRLAQQPLVLH
jgi:hypothetical protein